MSKMIKFVIHNEHTKSKIKKDTIVKQLVSHQIISFIQDCSEINLREAISKLSEGFSKYGTYECDPKRIQITTSQKIETTSIYYNSPNEINDFTAGVMYMYEFTEIYKLNKNKILSLTKEPIIHYTEYHIQSPDDELNIAGGDAETEHLM